MHMPSDQCYVACPTCMFIHIHLYGQWPHITAASHAIALQTTCNLLCAVSPMSAFTKPRATPCCTPASFKRCMSSGRMPRLSDCTQIRTHAQRPRAAAAPVAALPGTCACCARPPAVSTQEWAPVAASSHGCSSKGKSMGKGRV